ncbi:MAG: hypothetical protein F4X14_19045 [Caldilineaceae bacterium SB0661_bin_32]|uniref:DUF7424 domain-containing protein n=1 Tax=Caldilineaceae bacterium SB0661_bin_32 TaxID=2605255 RepID=A0A6B1DBU7_9CHLR|nr:hypothetical protein [Caldilineaceae bacterium SB0661_bin_32]
MKFSITRLNSTLVILTLIAVMAFVTACTTHMASELYLRDLDDLDEGELTNKIIFQLPLTTIDECSEYRARYDKVFRKSRDFKDMEFVKCTDGDFNDYVEYEMDVPLRKIDPTKSRVKGAVEFIRWDNPEQDENRLILIRTNPPSLADLDDHLKDEFFQGLDLTDSSPLIRLSNDLRSDQSIEVRHAFVQNQPVISSTTFTLEPRDSIDIVLSDVTSAWVFHVSATARPRIAPIGAWIKSD